jgi:hypothetical protein
MRRASAERASLTAVADAAALGAGGCHKRENTNELCSFAASTRRNSIALVKADAPISPARQGKIVDPATDRLSLIMR